MGPCGASAAEPRLFGDPSKPGIYVLLNKWLPGHMSKPHFHENDRYITVISGTWWVGTGDEWDPANIAPLAVYLASDLSNDVTGEVFGIRGGDLDRYLPWHEGDFYTQAQLLELQQKLIDADYFAYADHHRSTRFYRQSITRSGPRAVVRHECDGVISAVKPQWCAPAAYWLLCRRSWCDGVPPRRQIVVPLATDC